MSWRTIVISKRCKLELRLGYMVVRGEELKQVFIKEIGTLIIESTAVSLTSSLLCELVKNKVNIVFCDEFHSPQSQLLALSGSHNCSGQIKKQIGWSDEKKKNAWTEIVSNKIVQQAKHLRDLGLAEYEKLFGYLGQVEFGDVTNREGHSAKVYFNSMFGLKFKRADNNFINNALNYGYSILLSAFNRQVVACGYLTQIGLNHRNEFNHYNLSCDLMEPFRILVDRKVMEDMNGEFDSKYKYKLIDIMNKSVYYQGKVQTVTAVIEKYCKNIFNSIENESDVKIEFYENIIKE